MNGEIPDGTGVAEDEAEKLVEEKTPQAPSTEEAVRLLGPKFAQMLKER